MSVCALCFFRSLSLSRRAVAATRGEESRIGHGIYIQVFAGPESAPKRAVITEKSKRAGAGAREL